MPRLLKVKDGGVKVTGVVADCAELVLKIHGGTRLRMWVYIAAIISQQFGISHPVAASFEIYKLLSYILDALDWCSNSRLSPRSIRRS